MINRSSEIWKLGMRAAAICVLSLMAGTAPSAEDSRRVIQSPDGRVRLDFWLAEGGIPHYSIDRDSRPLVLPSSLGLELEGAVDFRRGFAPTVEVSRRSHDATWNPVYGERKEIRDHFNEMRIALVSDTKPGLRLVFRAYNEGVAFRYEVADVPFERPVRILAEHSHFRFPATVQAYEEHGTEGEYQRVRVGAIQPGCERPLTLEFPAGNYAALTEAACVDYSRMLLSPVAGQPDTLTSSLSGPVEFREAFATPWRVLIIGDRPGQLLERNFLVLNLNPPCAIADTSWIRPGKVIREVTLSTRGGLACVDFAVARGLQYIEYDAGWYGPENDDASDATTVSLDPQRIRNNPGHDGLDLQRVIDYGRERGIGVLVYVNRRALERQLDEILPLYQRWGIAGIKFGFVQVGPQGWTRWLHEAVRECAEHELVVDIHDGYRPTGFSRTYPNLLTQEGIRGNEHMPTAGHNVTLPFTRFVAGAGDYTICYYSDRLQTTRAHQLALSVVHFSPLQFIFWYDRPSNFHGEPEVDFFAGVPTVWDETRVLQGQIGDFILIARRHGRDWFVGALTDEHSRELMLDFDFLEPGITYAAKFHADGDPDGVNGKRVAISTANVTRESRRPLRLAPGGGQAIRLIPE